jgi:hypothetical protein
MLFSAIGQNSHRPQNSSALVKALKQLYQHTRTIGIVIDLKAVTSVPILPHLMPK